MWRDSSRARSFIDPHTPTFANGQLGSQSHVGVLLHVSQAVRVREQ